MKPLTFHQSFMKKALAEAKKAAKRGEVPVGAVLVKEGKVISKGFNLTRTKNDPTQHAEIVVLQKACKRLKNERFLGTVLYITLEPCAMCAGAIIQARVPTVVFGAKDPKAGACGSALKVIPHKKLNHRPKVVKNIIAQESSDILKAFFRLRR